MSQAFILWEGSDDPVAIAVGTNLVALIKRALEYYGPSSYPVERNLEISIHGKDHIRRAWIDSVPLWDSANEA